MNQSILPNIQQVQIAPLCLKSYTRLPQNEVTEPKPSTHFQSIQNLLSRRIWDYKL